MASIVKRNYLSELKKIDWDFVDRLGSRGLEGIHWYPARFVGEIPSILIGYFSEPGQVVLDPFCGSGTTLVEALRLGRNSLGIEINPVAAMMSRTKTEYIDPTELTNLTDLFLDLINSHGALFSSRAVPALPNLEENRAWYHERTLVELAFIKSKIDALKDGVFKDVANVCFSSILKTCCSQDKHWGYVCDNVKPRRLVRKKAIQLFTARLGLFTAKKNEFMLAVQNELKSKKWPSTRVLEADCREKLAELRTSSIDLIVTSPPYYNVTDYAKSQRLTFLWDEILPLETVRAKEIGARSMRFNSNAFKRYIADMSVCLRHMIRVLKRDSYLCLVLGQSSNYQPYIPVLRRFLRKQNVVLAQQIRRSIPKKRSLSPRLFTESILVMRKQ